MKQSDIITNLSEKVSTISNLLQETANLKQEALELTEKKNQLNKQLQFIKLSIEQKEKVLLAPYMEQTDPQQKTLFE